MKIKTSELTGAALDWAVAKCEGHTPFMSEHRIVEGAKSVLVGNRLVWEPSTSWKDGGPIIERENISFRQYVRDGVGGKWYAKVCRESGTQIYWKGWGAQPSTGDTPLVAAMRCYCASKLGEEVEIPEELK